MTKIDLGVQSRLRQRLTEDNFSCAIVLRPDNFLYAAGAQLPFFHSHKDRLAAAVFFPDSVPFILAPHLWGPSLKALGRIETIYGYDETGTDATESFANQLMAHVKKSMSLDKNLEIHLDLDGVSPAFYTALRKACPEALFKDCSSWVKHLRSIKTPKEQNLLKKLAYRTDHGIVGAAHHVLTCDTRPEKGLAEIIRIHCLERELEVVGYHSVSQAASGTQARKFWTEAPKFGVGWGKRVNKGELIRVEMRSSLGGYWGNASRIISMGAPNPEQKKAYEALVHMREAALLHMKPGEKCSAIYRAMMKAAEDENTSVVEGMTMGSGIGVRDREAPYIAQFDETRIAEGMVLVLSPSVYGPNMEILTSKDTVLIESSGNRLLGWYKDWREPYITSDSYYSGGG